jgi:hypothetical protein
LLLANPSLRLEDVRALLGLVTERGFDRAQDLVRKFDALIDEVRDESV